MPHTLRDEPGDTAAVKASKGRQRAAYFSKWHDYRERKRSTLRERYGRELSQREAAQAKRADQIVERDLARWEWEELRRTIENTSGKVQAGSVGKDYASLPREFRTRNRHASDIHAVAGHHGYEYADDWVKHVAAVKKRYDTTRKMKLEKVPKAPRKPKELHEKRGPKVITDPHIKHLRSEVRELDRMTKEAAVELGSNDPAVRQMREDLAELRKEYEEARNAA